MAHKRFLTTLSLSLLFLVLAACGTTIQTKADDVSLPIEIQDRPKGLDLHDVEFYVVTEENLTDFLEQFEQDYGNVVFVAMTIPDYENMSLNIADIKRYIEQQQSIIIFYEKSIQQ